MLREAIMHKVGVTKAYYFIVIVYVPFNRVVIKNEVFYLV